MAEKRVQFNQIVKSQLPEYVQDDFPLVGEFLSQYYQGQEYKGGPLDLIENPLGLQTDETNNEAASIRRERSPRPFVRIYFIHWFCNGQGFNTCNDKNRKYSCPKFNGMDLKILGHIMFHLKK